MSLILVLRASAPLCCALQPFCTAWCPCTCVWHSSKPMDCVTMQVFDMIETRMVKNGINNGLLMRLLYRSAYVVIVTFVAVTLPFFG